MSVLLYRVFSVLRFAFIGMVVVTIVHQFGGSRLPYPINLLFAGIGGFLLGFYYEFFAFKYIRHLPFIVRLLVQLVIIQCIIFVAAAALDLITSLIGYHILNDLFGADIFSAYRITGYVRAQIFSFILLFIFEIESILGRGFLYHYVIGRYNRPKKEHRIVMFLDLKGSTGLAESLGDEKYYQLLNDCYWLLSKPVIQTRGEILKYIGDEVVLSWSYRKGLQSNNCVALFHLFREAISAKAAYFRRKYGVVPEFKAGLHDGQVVAAYVGDIRKQLDCSGDVMNTTARIAGLCGRYDAAILLSEQLFHALPEKNYRVERISDAELKGKTSRMHLVNITGWEAPAIPDEGTFASATRNS